MRIHFYDSPAGGRRSREDVRFNQLGLYVHEDGRRVAVGFDITPFLERPSIEVLVTNEAGEVAAALTVIEALQPNFSLTMHLRGESPTGEYEVTATLYYPGLEQGRTVVDSVSRTFDVSVPGEH